MSHTSLAHKNPIFCQILCDVCPRVCAHERQRNTDNSEMRAGLAWIQSLQWSVCVCVGGVLLQREQGICCVVDRVTNKMFLRSMRDHTAYRGQRKHTVILQLFIVK